MSADLLERRRVDRREPRRLADLVADRRPDCWMDVLVSIVLPRMIDKQKAVP